jgi:hypothetical protein
MYNTEPHFDQSVRWHPGLTGFSLSLAAGGLALLGSGLVDFIAAAGWLVGIVVQIAARAANERIPSEPV